MNKRRDRARDERRYVLQDTSGALATPDVLDKEYYADLKSTFAISTRCTDLLADPREFQISEEKCLSKNCKLRNL